MDSREPSRSLKRSEAEFATTQWSLVLAAGEQGTEKSSRALEKLCRGYWPPLYAYARRRAVSIHEAQDLTQAFFERVLEQNYLADATPERGRFRAFLITAFKHFLANEWDRQTALKRGGKVRRLSLDFDSDRHAGRIETAHSETPDQIYERQWTLTLLDRVIQRLQREQERAGRGAEFHRLKHFIIGQSGESYAQAAADLGMNESAARMAASRMRQWYRQLLRDEIAQTVASPDDVDDEIQHMFAILSN
ncbi:MAG: sigma-70 family RNA polymerase sigma factor [Fuerstiella sp.]